MAEMMTTDVRAILDRTPFDVAPWPTSARCSAATRRDTGPSATPSPRSGTRAEGEGVQARGPPPAGRRRGAAGPLQRGLDHLTKAGDIGLAYFFRGLALENLQRRSRPPRRSPPRARRATTPSTPSSTAPARSAGPASVDEAQKILSRPAEASGRSAEYHYQRGSLLAADGELVAAAAEFEKALSLDTRPHRRPLRAGLHQRPLRQRRDRRRLLQAVHQRPPVPLAALINLGVLYEDEMRFREAEQCYRQVLAFDPNHPRARLFFKDCRASKDMYYDEEAERGFTVLKQLLEIPVTDFELSVRSRNCLRKMNIRTLGDLTRTTEAALLCQQELRRDLALRDQGDDEPRRASGSAWPWKGGERAADDHPDRAGRGSSRRRRRRCSPSRSAT